MLFKTFKFPNTSLVWRFQDPDTGYQYVANSREDLIKNIVSYRGNNDLKQIEELNTVLDNYLCSLPENVGLCEAAKLKRGLWGYMKGGLALLQFILQPKEKRVSGEIANARAEQCVKCAYNSFPDRGSFIRFTDEAWLHAIGDNKVRLHDQLGSCEVCSCPLRATVWFKDAPKLKDEQQRQMKDVGCWKLKGE